MSISPSGLQEALPGERIAGSCVVCGGPLAVRMANVLVVATDKAYSIVGCDECGLGQTWPAPTSPEDAYGSDYYGFRHSITTRLCDERRLGIVCRLTRAPGRLLDVGCGEGTFMIAARRAGWVVSGTELNPEPSRAKGLTVCQEPTGGPYECITLWHSLEHMGDPAAMIRRLRELLAPGGVLIAAVPDAGGLQARIFGPKWLHLDVPRHLFHFNTSSVEALMALSNLQVANTWHGEFEYDLMGWVQSVLNYLPASRNLFLRLLTGRARGASWPKALLHLILGGALTIITLPLAWGGTLLVAARHKHEGGGSPEAQ
jgi:SAM-dependent methyltransferase